MTASERRLAHARRIDGPSRIGGASAKWRSMNALDFRDALDVLQRSSILSHDMQRARIAGPIQYASGGTRQELPRGPCLLERIDDRHVDIIWGESGEHSAEIPVSEIKRAADHGDLVLIA